MQDKKENSELRHRILSIVGIVLCVILVPILIVNCTLLIKGWANQDEVPSFFSVSPLITLSGSMEEDFPAGSLIFTKKVEVSEIKEGDIISYFDPASKSGAVVTHKVRFVRTEGDGKIVFYTYGTANVKKPFEEVTELECEKIPAENLIGRYTGVHFNGLGDVAIFMQSTPGLILCVFVPLVALVAYDIIRRKLYEKKHADDKDELLRELEELRRLKAQTQSGEWRVESGDDTTPTDNTDPSEEK